MLCVQMPPRDSCAHAHALLCVSISSSACARTWACCMLITYTAACAWHAALLMFIHPIISLSGLFTFPRKPQLLYTFRARAVNALQMAGPWSSAVSIEGLAAEQPPFPEGLAVPANSITPRSFGAASPLIVLRQSPIPPCRHRVVHSTRHPTRLSRPSAPPLHHCAPVLGICYPPPLQLIPTPAPGHARYHMDDAGQGICAQRHPGNCRLPPDHPMP